MNNKLTLKKQLLQLVFYDNLYQTVYLNVLKQNHNFNKFGWVNFSGENMRSILIFLSAFVVIFLMYSLFVYTLTEKKNEQFQNSQVEEKITPLKEKLSIDQIDSLSASENYKFTIENYYKDVSPKNSDIRKG